MEKFAAATSFSLKRKKHPNWELEQLLRNRRPLLPKGIDASFYTLGVYSGSISVWLCRTRHLKGLQRPAERRRLYFPCLAYSSIMLIMLITPLLDPFVFSVFDVPPSTRTHAVMN